MERGIHHASRPSPFNPACALITFGYSFLKEGVALPGNMMGELVEILQLIH